MYTHLTSWSVEKLEKISITNIGAGGEEGEYSLTKYSETKHIVDSFFNVKRKSSIENVGIFLILVGGDVGRKGGLNTA